MVKKKKVTNLYLQVKSMYIWHLKHCSAFSPDYFFSSSFSGALVPRLTVARPFTYSTILTGVQHGYLCLCETLDPVPFLLLALSEFLWF